MINVVLIWEIWIAIFLIGGIATWAACDPEEFRRQVQMQWPVWRRWGAHAIRGLVLLAGGQAGVSRG